MSKNKIASGCRTGRSLKMPALLTLCLGVATIASAQTRWEKVDSWMDDNTSAMGGRSILMVWQDGKIVYTKSVNDQSRRQKTVDKYVNRRLKSNADKGDFTPDSREAIASCSKWLSAALVMTFVDEGKLKLTDTVGAFLPVLSQQGKGNITIEQCLSHRTAIKEPALKESIRAIVGAGSMDKAIENIAAMPMEGTPGEVFHYSNAGLQIAAAVIEKISGKSFETLFAERIAGPLGMKNTDFGKGKVALPAGGAISTTQDYLNFLVMILNKGMYDGVRVLSENSIEEMEKNRITPQTKIAYSPAEAEGLGYGFGEWVMGSAVTSPGLFGSFPWVVPEKGYCAFLMTFYFDSKGKAQRYRTLEGLVEDSLK